MPILWGKASKKRDFFHFGVWLPLEKFSKFAKNELKAVKVAAQYAVLAPPDSHENSRKAWGTLEVDYFFGLKDTDIVLKDW